MDFFKKINSKIPLDKRSQEVKDPIIYSDPNPEFYILTESISKVQISYIKRLMRATLGREANFQLIYSFIFVPKGKDLTKNVTNFVQKYSVDFKKYIPENSKILCMGRSIYSLTMETSFTASAFYPYDYVDTYFYHPDTKSYVFPVDDFFTIVSANEKRFYDIFETHFFRHQLKAIDEFVPQKVRIPSLKSEYVENPNEFLSQYIGKEMEVSWDLETTGLTFFKDDIICLTLSFDGKTGYYLDFKKIDMDILKEFFKGKFQIGANLKFDCKFLMQRGVDTVKIDFDTWNAGHCLNETRSNSLSTHGWVYTYHGGHELELQKFKKSHKRIKNYSQIPKSILSQYATMDAIVTFQVYKKQKELLREDGKLYDYYFNEVVPNLNTFLSIEFRGVFIDWEEMKRLRVVYEEKRKEKEKEIFSQIGFPFNLDSSKDLSHVLQHDLEFPDLGNLNKDNTFSTNEDSLLQWSKLGYKVADTLLEYRAISNFINMFLGSEDENTAYWEYRNGRVIHPEYQVMLAQSHRNRCKNPNLQQVPKRVDSAKIFRKVFVTENENFDIAEGDFAGFQLRIASVLSGDENLKEAFTKYGGDVHSMTAIAVFHQDLTLDEFMKLKKESPYKDSRNTAKSINFAFLFGGSAYSFANDVIRKEWTREQCITFLQERAIPLEDDVYFQVADSIRNAFFQKYPKLAEWHETCHETAKKFGAIWSVYGARRLLPKLKYIGQDTSGKELSEYLNISKNSPVQNFEVVAILRGIRIFEDYIKERGLQSSAFGMIHDSAEFYLHKGETEEMIPVILEIFQRDYPEYEGVTMAFELEISDISQGEVWGFGREVS